MDDHAKGKVNGIRQIVRLKELIHRWHHATIGQKADHRNPTDPSSPGGISPAINRRLKSCNVYVDLDEENCQSPDPPPDIPKGFLAVYVGLEQRSGALAITCETETFKYLLKCMENHQKDHGVRDNAEKSLDNKV
ncbi:Auxin-induced protein 15A [Heracleum sosnowskyi]|uniref:Auxin-induced protein 15A n=1 Tax=Heracleum sosnowskyi TaxID=360622 RepID=A0AAD8HQW9_9APIA|nr:Auxin-induced protein 15A [Heracleum sosnowskyi]